MATNEDSSSGVIHPDELYTLSAIKRRLGVREATMRAARRAGLRVYYVHKHAYVYGRDWIDYVLGSEHHRNGLNHRSDGDVLPSTVSTRQS